MGDRTGTDFIGGMLTGSMRSAVAKERGGKLMVFDWDKAARIIVERKPQSVEAGLTGDWNNTGGEIYRDGQPVPQDETYTYLASMWATPKMILDEEDIDCWRPADEAPGWDSGTYWPESALAILNAGTSS